MFLYNVAFDLDSDAIPPGWSTGAPEDDRYWFQVNRCERVSLGPFERGPVHILMEATSGVSPPASCGNFNAGYEDLKVLLGLWTDDSSLAEYLATTYQMPVRSGSFTVDVTEQAGYEVHTWTWTGDAEESTMVGMRLAGPEDPAPFLNRFVWHNGTGVTLLDLQEEPVLHYQQFPTAQGVLAPPMRYAQGTPRPFSGLASVWNEGDSYGPLFRFGDMECKELLS